MTINDIPNINNCEIEEIGIPVFAIRIRTKDGWRIHLDNGVEDSENLYKKVAILILPYDFSKVKIISENDIPDSLEIQRL